MSRSKYLDYTELQSRFRDRLVLGPLLAREALQFLSPISQQSFSKLVTAMHEDLVVIGKARSTCYALRRNVSGCMTPIILFEIDHAAKTRRLASMIPVYPRGFLLEFSSGERRLFDDFPYFLDDLRPAGFLGRLIPLQHPNEGYPKDVRLWSSDHTLLYLTRHGWNPVGNFIVGEVAFQIYMERATSSRDGISSKDRGGRYLRIADNLMGLSEVGSSAAGEQPKFICELDRNSGRKVQLIVKFSPNDTGILAERRADLLVCEHIAHLILKKHGYPSVDSQILSAGKRTFLEMKRFDRTEAGGRFGVITLAALNLEFVGEIEASWSRICSELLLQEQINEQTLSVVRELEIFGTLIGNADMHFGNLSFYTSGFHATKLAPVYDMMPSLYAPSNESIVEREFVPPLPRAEHSAEWQKVHPMAVQYWKSVLSDDRISHGFKRIAKTHLQKLVKLKTAIVLLP